ncbi:MAG: glycosyltransferase family 4 protein [Cyanobacteria bacterium P01_G01_bin.49]
MKVTFCASDFPNQVGGPYAWLPRLLPDLRARSIEPRVLFFSGGKIKKCQSIQQVKQQGFPHEVSTTNRYTRQRVRWILEKLSEDPPDVFIPNLLVPAFYASHWVKKAGIPTIGILHSDDSFYHAAVDQFVLGSPKYQVSKFVCVSRFLQQTLLEKGVPQTTIPCIPYGVPVPQDTAKPPTDKLKIIYLGRLVEEQKQISQLAQAFCRAVKEVPNTEAVIYGSGNASSSVEKILAEQGKDLPVRLGGIVPNSEVQKYLLEAHVIVLLSDYEGLPIALMEAMACGVVPICLRIRSGIPELVEEGVSGLLVSDRQDDFVNAIRRLREEPHLWKKLSQGARSKIEAEYSNHFAADLWAELLAELVQNAKATEKIKVPRFFVLPTVHPAFVQRDPRPPALPRRLVNKSAYLLKKTKQKLSN